MPQFMPLLAASEPVYGTLSAGTKDYMCHALLNCKGKTRIETRIGNSKLWLAAALQTQASRMDGALLGGVCNGLSMGSCRAGAIYGTSGARWRTRLRGVYAVCSSGAVFSATSARTLAWV